MSARQYGSSFGFYKSDRSQTNVDCKLCKTIVPAGKTGSTTNVFYHLSRSHPLGHSRIKKTANNICKCNAAKAAADHHGEVLGISAL
jgi:hypothetical protein